MSRGTVEHVRRRRDDRVKQRYSVVHGDVETVEGDLDQEVEDIQDPVHRHVKVPFPVSKKSSSRHNNFHVPSVRTQGQSGIPKVE